MLSCKSKRLVNCHCCRRVLIESQDLRACCDQLQTIGKEVHALEESTRESTALQDHLGKKKIEENELQLRQEVISTEVSMLFTVDNFLDSVSTSSCPMLKRS
jgi:hypothetical protein